MKDFSTVRNFTLYALIIFFVTACQKKEKMAISLPPQVKVGNSSTLGIILEKQGFLVTNVQKQGMFDYELLPDGQQTAVIEALTDTTNQLDNSGNINISINGKNISKYKHDISTLSKGKDTLIFSINSFSTIYRIVSKDSVVNLKMAVALKDNETLCDTAVFSLIK